MLSSTDCVEHVAWSEKILFKLSAVQVKLHFQCDSSLRSGIADICHKCPRQ